MHIGSGLPNIYESCKRPLASRVLSSTTFRQINVSLFMQMPRHSCLQIGENAEKQANYPNEF